MNQNIRIEHIQDAERLESLQSMWEDLHHSSPLRDAFLTWEWFSAWWKHYGSDKDLWLVAAWQADSLVGLAPLMRVRKKKYGFPFRVLKPLSAPDCDVSGFLIRDGDQSVLTALCEFIIKRKSQWDVIQLSEIEQDSPQTQMMIAAFQKAGYGIYLRPTKHYYQPLEGGWENFFNQQIPKNVRNDVRRRIRRAEEVGEIVMQRMRGRDVKREHFQSIFDINANGHFPDMYRSEQDQAFHLELMERMREREIVEIHLMSINGTATAFRYGFVYDNRFEDWRNGFNQQFPQLSVGKILLKMALEEQFKQGYREFDYLRGIDDYKARWHPLERAYTAIDIASPFNVPAYAAFIGIPLLKDRMRPKNIVAKEGETSPVEE
jgi:CelD/BcsL family acetyltransferase involved in cellulose biosynthesis